MLKVGKLDNALLSKAVINRIKCKRPEVLVHARSRRGLRGN